VDIFNTQTGEWVQSIGLKKSRPLSFNGNLSMMVMNDAPYVIYLANLHTSKFFEDHFEKQNVNFNFLCDFRGTAEHQQF
jgi:serine/threonine-protein kinase MRCK